MIRVYNHALATYIEVHIASSLLKKRNEMIAKQDMLDALIIPKRKEKFRTNCKSYTLKANNDRYKHKNKITRLKPLHKREI